MAVIPGIQWFAARQTSRPVSRRAPLGALLAMVAVGATWLLGGSSLSAAPLGAEKLPDGIEIVALESHPAAVKLTTAFSYAQLLVTARLAGGEQLDVTRAADAEWPADVASISATGVVRPKQDGAGQIRFSLAGHSVSIPLEVAGIATPRESSFVRDVMPVMSKMGCNAGTCHGSLNGKNGFKLSLRGYDALHDHRALTDDLAGRRFNRVAPEESLMLLKSSGAIPHVGGALSKPGEPYYELLRGWIAAGVKLDLDSPRVTNIDLLPKNPIVPRPGMKQQVAVLATYSDGAVRDVTLEAFVASGAIEIVEVDKQGLVTMLRRGEAPLLARYEGAYTATTLTVMGDRTGFEWRETPVYGPIDELVNAKLRRVRTAASDLCGDAEFIRRVYLDLIGLPPQVDEIRAFLADARETRVKREELIDRLIGSPEYVEHWTNKWSDLLQVNRKFLGERGAAALRAWIRNAIATNMPYDQFVNAILTGSGSTVEHPPAAYFKTLRTPEELVENTTQLFLAVRFNCNKCHDHPFERWTQNQYYHLAAFFAQVGRKDDPAGNGQRLEGTNVESAKAAIEDIFDSGSGEEKHLTSGQVAPPEFPYQHSDLAAGGEPRRERLAHWLTSKQNQYFAKSYANRLWGYLFGRGVIEPIDDIRAGNPPTNPELLDWLTQRFLASDFDTQDMLRVICKSATYQRSIAVNRWNEDDEINYSHALARRLPAEVLYDTIMRSAGSTSQLPGLPAGAHAAQLLDPMASPPSGFLEQFGRPPRESACECERSTGVMLGPVMTLVNGPTIADALVDGGGAIAHLVKTQPDDAKLVEEIFYRFLCRPPTASELTTGVKALSSSDEDRVRARAELAAHETRLDALQRDWESKQGATAWTELAPLELSASHGATPAAQPDHAVLVEGPLGKGAYTVKGLTDLTGVTGVRLEALADGKLPSQGPGRAPNGNFVLSEFQVTAASVADPTKTAPAPLENASSDFSQDGYPVASAIDGNPGTGWAVFPRIGKNHVAVFEFAKDTGFAGGTLLTFLLDHQHDDAHALGKFRLSLTTSPRPLATTGPPEAIAAILSMPPEQRSNEQKAALTNYFRSLDAQWRRLREAVALADRMGDPRLIGAQDLAWALINSPAFLFNR